MRLGPNLYGDRPQEFYGVNWDDPLTRRLAFWVPVHGPQLVDVIEGVRLAATTSVGARSDIGHAGPLGGAAYRCDAADEGMEVTAPAHLKLTIPFSLAFWCIPLGTPQSNAGFFGCVPNNSDSSPFCSYGFYLVGSNWGYKGNSAGSFFTRDSGVAPVVNQPTHLVAIAKSATDVDFYVNGVRRISGAGALSSPNYTSTALVFIGDFTGVSRNSNILAVDARMWTREITQDEVRSLYFDPWASYLVPRTFSGKAPAVGGGSAFPDFYYRMLRAG